ncbi:MAG: ATP-binding protein, partial [Phenylobacterium sp.]|uniref:hybrid sensor histidine kinase/response regulator n=1 Tax=Phenylobacterium sp. TaxID=1871053 RepID=UPI0027304CBB
MRRIRRQTISLAAAVMLPLLILAGFQLYDGVNARRLELEALSRSRAGEIVRLVDAQVRAEMKLALVLASAESIKQDDAPRLHGRAREFRDVTGSWRTVRLTDPQAGIELFDLRRPSSAPPRPAGADVTALGVTLAAPLIGGVELDSAGAYAVPLHLPIRRDGRLRYILTVEIDPYTIQRIAVARYPPETVVAAVVDRSGRFISRSLNYEARLGRPGSAMLRSAVIRGGEGFYRNVTLEGVPTYTGYVTSPLTGWSTHVAVSSSPFEAARYWSMAIWVVVVLGCLALSGLMIGLTLRDMDQVRREDEGLRQAQKMEALGHLTGGIAHDFNNLLTGVIGSLDLMQRRIESGRLDDVRRFAATAMSSANRAAALAHRLLAFSRRQPLVRELVDIDRLVTSIEDLLRRTMSEKIELNLAITAGGWRCECDPNQFESAVLNLAINARDAMPDGGRLTIRTGHVTVGVDQARGLDVGSGQYVFVAVEDTGEGMAPEVIDHVFEPFFTTKPLGVGTGLGLPMIYSFARQSGGAVKIESVTSRGTTITIFMPRSQAKQDAVGEKPTLGSHHPAG